MEQAFIDAFQANTDRMMSFVMLSSDYISHKNEYSPDHELTMVEMHTLAKIAEDPGICISQIARQWNRTLGAVSQIVNSLHKKGYIEKKKLPGNNKTIHLYPTESGEILAAEHQKIDRIGWQKTLDHVLKYHSVEELQHFLSVMDSFIEYMQKINKV